MTEQSDPVGVLENIQKRDPSLKLNNPPPRGGGDWIGAISNPKLLALAYELIKSKPGNMTPWVDRTTLDSFDFNPPPRGGGWIQKTAAKLQAGLGENRCD